MQGKAKAPGHSPGLDVKTNPLNYPPTENRIIDPSNVQVSFQHNHAVLVYPSEFRQYRQWVVWRLEHRNGRKVKMPYNPITLLPASPTDSSTWSDFQTAYQVAQETGLGLGFVFTSQDPFIFIDLDNILTPEYVDRLEALYPWLAKLNGFIEISQSSKGLHIFLRCENKPAVGRRKGKEEIYTHSRFVALTGKPWAGKVLMDTIKWNDLVKQFPWLAEEKPSQLPQVDEPKNINPQDSSTVDQDVVEQVAQKVERKHPDLWNGSWESKHPSQSEADLALMNSIVSVWRKETGRIPTLQEAVAIFHRSELGSRDKAYRADYLERTYTKALEVLENSKSEVVEMQERKSIIKTAKDKRDRIKRAKLVENLIEAGVFNDIAYDPQFDKFCRWTGKQYAEINENELKRRIQEIARQEREIIMDDTLTAVIKTLKTLVPVYSIAEPPYLIPVENGVLIPVRKQGDIVEFEFKPHDPQNGNVYVFPVKYDPTAKCERWLQFLNEVVPSEEDRLLLQEYVGYMLIPLNHLNFQKALFIIGTGANGKSVFANTIIALLGERNVATLRFDQMTGHQLEALVGKVANISTEVVGDGRHVETSLWKQIVVGDTITINPKYRSPFEYRSIAKHLYAINEMPRITDTTDGTWRKMMIVRFPVRIPPERQDPWLIDKLLEELPGILNWALEGLARILANDGFTCLAKTEELVEEFRINENVVELWLRERTRRDDGAQISFKEVYDDFVAWIKENNFGMMSSTRFSKILQDLIDTRYPYIEKTVSHGNTVIRNITLA